MEKQNFLFEPVDEFMIRTPIFPLEFYHELCENSEEVLTYSDDPFIQECIAVSSLSLHNMIHTMRNSKQREQVDKSMFKYLNRMSTRATPFGLFSGVASGVFSSLTKLKLNEASTHKKRARPDMEWLLKVVSEVEKEVNVVRKLHVKFNDMAYRAGERLKIPYLTYYGQKNRDGDYSLENTTIRYSELVAFTKGAAKKEILFTDLMKEIKFNYPGATAEQIEGFLLQLFQNELLLSTLRPPLSIHNPFDYVINYISEFQETNDLYIQLNEIKKKINDYNKLKIGEGLALFISIVDDMDQIAKVKTPLQIDLKLNTSDNTLNEKIKKDISSAATALWRMAPGDKGLSHLKEYRTSFMEKYGTDREVPILELLDENMGLGAPSTYKTSTRFRNHSSELQDTKTRTLKFYDLIKKANDNQCTEVELTEKDIVDLEPENQDMNILPNSFDLNFVISGDENNHELFIGPNVGSSYGGQMFGRFLDMFPSSTREKLHSIHEHNKKNTKGVLAEIIFMPRKARAANVILTENNKCYEILIGVASHNKNKEHISLDDLVVGHTGERLYLKSRKLNQEVIPMTSHMLNTSNNVPNIYRFLYELGFETRKSWSPIDWGMLKDASFLPRIKYGNCVLFPASWNIKKNNFELNNLENEDEWLSSQTEWRIKNKLPQYVYLAKYDNRILLNLENKTHVLFLRKELLSLPSNQSIHLTEIDFNMKNTLVKNEKNESFTLECVFPLVKKACSSFKENTETVIKENSTIDEDIYRSDRLKFPGSDWLYIKLYGVGDRFDEFLVNQLSTFTKNNNELFDHYFFMRYADPEPHIRVRFKGSPSKLIKDLLPNIHTWSVNLKKAGLLNKIVIDTYDPEIERYGGYRLINWAEEVFYADSEFVTEMVQTIKAGRLNADIETVSIISTIDYLDLFSESFTQQLEWIYSATSYEKYKKEFRNIRNYLMKYGNSNNYWNSLKEDPNLNILYNALMKRRPLIKQYIKQMHEAKDLSSYPQNIMGSFIHLHLNRLLGMDREKEKKTMIMVRHTLHNLKYMKEKELAYE